MNLKTVTRDADGAAYRSIGDMQSRFTQTVVECMTASYEQGLRDITPILSWSFGSQGGKSLASREMQKMMLQCFREAVIDLDPSSGICKTLEFYQDIYDKGE